MRLWALLVSFRATIGITAALGAVYAAQLYVAGSTAPTAAATVVPTPDQNRATYVLLSPWLHTSHSHALWNVGAFALLGAWTEHCIGSRWLVWITVLTGYAANGLPPYLGIGPFGVGSGGVTFALVTVLGIVRTGEYTVSMALNPFLSPPVLWNAFQFVVAGSLMLVAILSVVGIVGSPPGTATQSHLLGVVLGALWAIAWVISGR